ncbi:MAG TPA: zinc metalloprotease [Vicinamibacteria bacterium]|nr:zinc metalloprotease [Vicinamibacteria bacterium]
MKRVAMAAALVLAGAVAVPAQELAAPGPDIHIVRNGRVERGVRCAAERPSAETMAEADRIVSEMIAEGRVGGDAPAAVTVPVVFHVIHNGTEGNVPEAWLDAQVQVLNNAFRNTGFSFTKARVNRVQDKRAFTGCYSNQNFKRSLADDPAHNLNFYTCKPKGNILGYAYLPWSYSEENWHHGVVVLYDTLPGGAAAPYNEGDTGTHEVGHYLGLYHTFERGCQEPGDAVSDTPFEASAAFGCPVGRDTCSQPGLDPILNFMDYTDDPCMNTFSGEQGTRMQAVTAQYKPSLGQ